MFQISVCIPVFNTEPYLLKCLESVSIQDFKNLEVIVVNDNSNGTDAQGKSCKEIIKEVKKKYKLKIKYIEHEKNKGILEVRRTLVYNSSSPYIIMLDSDDTLPPFSIKSLYNKAIETSACIVQGNANVVVRKEDENINTDNIKSKFDNKIMNTSEEITLHNQDIFNNYLVENKHNGFLWGKIIKTELYKNAFDYIPNTFCIIGDDFIQYFYISYLAKKYVKIPSFVYNYSLDLGITSTKEITSLDIWEKNCSSASIFTALYTKINEIKLPLTKEQADCIVSISYQYLASNIISFKQKVSENIRDEAYSLLCDYWGTKLVQSVENQLIQQGIKKE